VLNGAGLDQLNGAGLDQLNGAGLDKLNGTGLGLDELNGAGLGLIELNGAGLDKLNGAGLGLDELNGAGLGLDELNGAGLDKLNGARLELGPELNGAGPDSRRPLQVAALGGRSFRRIASKERLAIFSLSLYEINRALQPEKKQLNLADYVPKEYHEFLPLFSEAVAKAVPPHRPYDHKIPLREGFTPPFGPHTPYPRPSCRR